jgi:hypothetical protein
MMSARPKGDLADLAVPKEPPAASPPPPDGSAGRGHTLSLRLTAEQYRRLRRFVAAEEDRTGRRVTHQSIIESALDEYLSKHGA